MPLLYIKAARGNFPLWTPRMAAPHIYLHFRAGMKESIVTVFSEDYVGVSRVNFTGSFMALICDLVLQCATE